MFEFAHKATNVTHSRWNTEISDLQYLNQEESYHDDELKLV